MNIKTALIQHKQMVDGQIVVFLGKKKAEHKQVDGVLAEMIDNLTTHILRGGKRVRPMLAMLAYELGGGKDKKKMLKASVALELTHQFLLTHDDIVDRDEKRYGGPTVELIYREMFKNRYKKDDSHLGLAMGLIAGDYLQTLAREALWEAGFDAETTLKASRWLDKVLVDTVAGWQIQFLQNHEPIEEADENRFLKGAQLVSARYTFEGPLMFGLTLADNKDLVKSLTTYANNVGLAFQIQDDVLGMFGESKTTGKPVGNDFREGKKTLLVLRAYKNSTNEQKKYIKKKLGTNITLSELSQVQKIMEETGALEYSLKKAQQYIRSGKQAIKSITDTKQGKLLWQLADYVVKRKK